MFVNANQRGTKDSGSKRKAAIRFAICGALATALVTGYAGTSTLASARSDKGEAAKAAGQMDRAVAKAEAAVEANPRDGAARAALGNAYLAAGRFGSAATTFQDAIALGDSSGGTALRLALAQIGTGHHREAVVILDMQRDAIPAGDLGLALALAGETGRGVDILVDAVRGGENTAKLRQNLAYAYALDGRWLEAKQMAAFDVPANQLDTRIATWALTGRPEDYATRVAGLLGAPLRADAGQPAALALGDRPSEASEVQPALALAPPSGELPPSDPSREFAIAEPEASAPAAPAAFSTAFAEAPISAEVMPAPQPAAPPSAVRAVAQPILTAPVFAAKTAPAVRAQAKPLGIAALTRGSSHSVQLGSFSSPENARRALKLLQTRNPELKGFDLTITPAVVRGKNFWRVAAGTFNQKSAFGLCSNVRTRGGGCFAYSSARSLPGALPARGKSGPALARR